MTVFSAVFKAPVAPDSTKPLPVGTAGPTRFALRVLLAAPGFTLPAAALVSLHMVGEALVPVIIGVAIDLAIETGDPGQLLLWLAVLGCDFLVLSFAYRLGSRIGLLGMQRVQHRLRCQLIERLLSPQQVGHGHHDGSALSVAASDVGRLAAVMQLGVFPVGEVASVVVASIALHRISPGLGLAAACGAVVLLIAMVLCGGPLRRRSLIQQERIADAAGSAADLLAGFRVIRGLRAETEAGRRYRETSRSALEATLLAKSARGQYEAVLGVLGGVFVTGLAVLAGLLTLSGELAIGGLISAVGLIQFVLGPLTAMPTHTGYIWAVGLASAARVLRVLRAVPDHCAAAAPVASARTRLHTPDGAGSPVLQVDTPDIEFRLRPGECVGVALGQRAAARLMHLLAGQPAQGSSSRVLLSGSGVGEVGLEAWRGRILVAPHQAQLFDGTLAENLATPGSSRAEFPAALHAAACDDIVDMLPRGIDTPIGEEGALLSGGEQQRVALARAYAARAPILVLHDPTTSIDAATEHLIAGRLRAIRGDRSTLLITAAPALLAVCDRVIRSPDEDRA